MNLIDAIKVIVKRLMLEDEPLKADSLLRELNMPDFSKEQASIRGCIAHLYDEELYKKIYGNGGEFKIEDVEKIEPELFAAKAQGIYPRYQWFIDGIKDNKPETYLDLACYVGSLVITTASMGIKSYGVDLTKEALIIAERRAKENGVSDKATFFLEDITKFNKVKADVVTAFEVIEHVLDPEEFIKHLLSLSNGWVYISTPNGSYDMGTGNAGHWEWDGNPLHVRGHVRVFKKSSLSKLLEKCGCEYIFDDSPDPKELTVKFRAKKG